MRYCKIIKYILNRNGIHGLTKWITRKSVRHAISTITKNQPLIRLIHSSNRRLHPNKFSDSDPYKLLWVNPSEITYVTGDIFQLPPGSYHLQTNKKFTYRRHGFSPIISGEWDKNTSQFNHFLEYESIESYLNRNTDWSETELYQRHLDLINIDQRSYGCFTEQCLKQRFINIDNLINNIQQNGYLSSRSQGNHPLDEIRVNIGRDGKFFFNSHGRHRLSIAKSLDIDQIPVIVMARHPKWQQIRDQYRQSGINHRIDHHPDLNNIV